MASKEVFTPNFPPPGRKFAGLVGPHNFKEHFDADILEYVCEDVRLSTLQRKLVRENNTMVAHALSCQISDTIYFLDNRAYVFRSHEVICDAAFEVIHSSKHGDKVKSETANAIGRVGFILATYNDGDFDPFWKYYKKIWDRFRDGSKKEKDLVYFVKIFQVILSTKPFVKEVVITPMLDDLQETLEKTENPLIVPPLINALGLISQQHVKLFEPRFQDIVDILVGWHVDTGQGPSLKLQISTILLSWHSFWIIDLDFSANLLRQFIEDIESFTEDIEDGNSSPAELNECIEKIASVVQVFNTVLSCLRTKSKQKAVSFLPSESLKWGYVILRCLVSTLKQRHDEDILLAGQQSIMMLLERKESLYNDNEAKMKEFHEISIKSLCKLSYRGQSLTLDFVDKMINHVEKSLQVEFVTAVLKIDLVHLGAVTNGKQSRAAIVNFFRGLLNSRNILVLQECYSALVGPYQKALVKLCEDEPASYHIKVLLFILECLFDLVHAKGSVLSMWALDPPLFLLLAQDGGLANQKFARVHPMVHHALLRMLKNHCGCHHQFLASSQLLVQSNQSSLAPTTTYFQKVLKTLTQIMQLDLNHPSQELMQNWAVEVLVVASKNQHELSQSGEFKHFLKTVLKKEHSEVIECFLDNYSSSQLLYHHDIYGIVCKKLDENEKGERVKAKNLIPKLPPLVLDWIQCETKSYRGGAGEEKLPRSLTQSEFKSFCSVLIGSQMGNGTKEIDQELELGQLLDVLGVSFASRTEKIEWVGDEIANYCIANKLKTPFGKAQDTLAAYEKAMRTLVGKHQEVSIQQARNFLVIFERLEKAMYNAWDGNNISAFFVANKKTCLDWLSRVQLMAAFLGFYVGEFAFAYRQSQKALKVKIEGQVQEDLVALAAVSLKNLDNGPDNLAGLYAWAAENLSKKFRWIKGLICIAKKRYEEGVELIKTHFEGTKGLCYELLLREIALGHLSVCESQSYSSWLDEYKKKNENLGDRVDFFQKSLDALCSFEQGSHDKDLLNGIDVEKLKPQYVDDLLIVGQVQLMKSICNRNHNLTSVGDIVSRLYEDHALTPSHMKRTAILGSVQNMAESKSTLDTFLTYRERSHEASNLLLVKKWGDYFIRFSKQQPHLHFQLTSLNLEIAIQARKERNLKLATKHMEQNLGTNGSDVVSYIKSINFAYPMLYLSTDRANCLRQSAKLCYALQPQDNHSKMVAVQVLSGIGYIGLKRTDNLDLWSIAGRSFNTLAKWLRKTPNLMDPDVVSSTQETVTLTEILSHQPISETETDDSHLLVTDACSDGDMVIGRLLKLAVTMAPEMAKVWYEFANWCLEMGEKVLASSINGRIALTNREKNILKDLSTSILDDDGKKEIADVLSLVHLKVHGEVEVDKTEFMRKTLSKKLQDDVVLENILGLWQQVQKRIFYYQEMATKCYFRFISLSSVTEKKEQRVISATLRLLQLIVKHSFELQECLQNGLDDTPSECWRAIIPQLFSRLNHPVKAVRSRISDLLCRIARDFPNLVIYPAIVGSMASETVKVSKLFDQSQDAAKAEDIINEDEEEEATPQIWQSAHEKIVHTMATTLDDDRIDHVKILVSELQRVSILWDELWYGTIQQYSNEVLKRVNKMEDEVQKLLRNDSLNSEEKKELVKDKYFIHFKPLLYVFNKIEAITKHPESPAEEWFSGKYGKFIEEMMVKLRDPPDFNKPRETWSLLNQLQSRIAAKLLKKGQLQLSEISPALANLRDSLIPLPGQEGDRVLTVRKFENVLTILPTKTKPKKLKIQGSDGRHYAYLFKGLEDLHLDERIMQFLSIANTLMKTKNPGFRARHYSVVPLGPRSGLIQWVEGAVPLFTLYKKWLQRRQLSLELTKKTDVRPTPQKPADQFYNKLIPLLRDHGIHNLDNRKEWPLAVMRQVLIELMEETPKDLLSLTLWLSANSSSEWHKLNGNLTKSIAVMSVIGYIIGLGDRHLDNLLLDFKRGEIIHIDYNVCFEKGAKLRIPERVPFRLTQNIVNVFGLTGVEGVFRLSCEKTLESLRSGKETLLTLLEAFIYDPLVDWTPGVELGLAGAFARNAPEADGNQMVQDKRDMQAEITFSMLSVRVAEMKGAWMENKASLVSDLNAIEDSLSGWLDQTCGMLHLKESLGKLHKTISILKEAEANSAHKLFALQDRYAEHRAVEVAVAASKEKVVNFIEEYEKIANLYQRVIAGLSGGQLAKWNSDLSALGFTSGSTCSIVSEFLKSAGQSQLLEQLEAVETAFRISLDKLRASLHLGLQLFGHCTTMAAMYPQSYKENHRVHLYLQWMRRLTEDFNLERCQEIVLDFNKRIADTDPDAKRLVQHQAMNLNFQLENWSQEIHFRLQAIFHLMMRKGIENSKSVEESGLTIQSEVEPFLQPHLRLAQSLCINQLAEASKKVSELEARMTDGGNEVLVQSVSEARIGSVLDEFMIEVGYVSRVAKFMARFGLAEAQLPLKMLNGFSNVTKQFRLLIGNYFAIILQEGLKNCQKEDGSLDSAASSVIDILKVTDMRVSDVVQGILNKDEACVEVGRAMDDAFVGLIKKYNSSGNLTPGQMIVLAVNALLDNVHTAMADTCPQEADHEFELLAAKVSKIDVLTDFFALCVRAMNCFKCDQPGQLFPNGDEMGQPVAKFMNEYFLRHFKNRFSQAISLLVSETLAENLKDMNIDDVISQQMSEARDKGQYLNLELRAIFANLRKVEIAVHLEHKVEILNAYQQINQLQRNSFQWFHEDNLPAEAITPVPPLRSQVLLELKNCLMALTGTQKELADIQARYLELHGTVEQRLKWACGANPDLQENFDKFSSSFASEIETMKSVLNVAKAMSKSANSVIHHESLRTFSREAVSSDSFVMALLGECHQSAQLQEAQAANQELGPLELGIFSMNPPEDLIDQKWIKATGDLVVRQVHAIQKEIDDEKEKIRGSFHSLQSKIFEFKKTLTSHQKLMANMGSLIRSIDKNEELEVQEIKSYLNNYREFTENIGAMLKKVTTSIDELTEEKAREVLADVETIKESLPGIYDQLISMSVLLKDENIDQFKKPGASSTSATVAEVENSSANAEEKNTFALSVLKRIKMKLDGREPDVLRKASVAEQVDFIIREATNVDNLALLYEGWTAWI